jgi:hypothetical protein
MEVETPSTSSPQLERERTEATLQVSDLSGDIHSPSSVDNYVGKFCLPGKTQRVARKSIKVPIL